MCFRFHTKTSCELSTLALKPRGDVTRSAVVDSKQRKIFLISGSFWKNMANSYVGNPLKVGTPSYGEPWICVCNGPKYGHVSNKNLGEHWILIEQAYYKSTSWSKFQAERWLLLSYSPSLENHVHNIHSFAQSLLHNWYTNPTLRFTQKSGFLDIQTE